MEGGIFGLGGVADKSVTLAWYFQGISCSLSPVLASAAQVLPSSIPKRNEVIADLFPFKDSHQWLAGEVVRHFGAAEDIPKQTSRRSKPRALLLTMSHVVASIVVPSTAERECPFVRLFVCLFACVCLLVAGWRGGRVGG
ncbi:RMD1 [Symbiodinium sp. CCMP2592]|nr:RMD1 [Symbiodinium sp. CCMP2592]